MAPQTFTLAFTAAQFAAAAEQAKQNGLALTGAQGILPKQRGVQLGYSVNQAQDGSAVVTFTVISKPALFSVGVIKATLKQMLNLV